MYKEFIKKQRLFKVKVMEEKTLKHKNEFEVLSQNMIANIRNVLIGNDKRRQYTKARSIERILQNKEPQARTFKEVLSSNK